MKRGQLLLALFAALAVGAVAWFAGGSGDKEETSSSKADKSAPAAAANAIKVRSPTRRRRRSCWSR